MSKDTRAATVFSLRLQRVGALNNKILARRLPYGIATSNEGSSIFSINHFIMGIVSRSYRNIWSKISINTSITKL